MARGVSNSALWQAKFVILSPPFNRIARRWINPLPVLPKAQTRLAAFHFVGLGTPMNVKEAVRLWGLAAAQENQKAYRNLGVAYRVAPAPLTNLAESYRWSKKSADAGDPASQYATGIMLIRGEGPPVNFAEGAKYLKMAAGQGNLDAVWMLGGLYGSPENRTVYNVDEATRWLKLAIPPDPEKAYIQICSIHATNALAQRQLNVPALTKAMAWCAIAEKQALKASQMIAVVSASPEMHSCQPACLTIPLRQPKTDQCPA